MAAVRSALEQRLKSLESELHQVERLQRKFAMIHSTLAQQQTNGGSKQAGEGDAAPAKSAGAAPGLRDSQETSVLRSSLPLGASARVSTAAAGGSSCGDAGPVDYCGSQHPPAQRPLCRRSR